MGTKYAPPLMTKNSHPSYPILPIPSSIIAHFKRQYPPFYHPTLCILLLLLLLSLHLATRSRSTRFPSINNHAVYNHQPYNPKLKHPERRQREREKKHNKTIKLTNHNKNDTSYSAYPSSPVQGTVQSDSDSIHTPSRTSSDSSHSRPSGGYAAQTPR